MSRGILLAWLAGMGLVTWRGVAKYKKPVPPGQYLAASGVYAMLGLVAEWQPAAPVAALMAWGFDLAVFLDVLPGQVAPKKTTAAPATVTAPGGAGPGRTST